MDDTRGVLIVPFARLVVYRANRRIGEYFWREQVLLEQLPRQGQDYYPLEGAGILS